MQQIFKGMYRGFPIGNAFFGTKNCEKNCSILRQIEFDKSTLTYLKLVKAQYTVSHAALIFNKASSNREFDGVYTTSITGRLTISNLKF